MLFYAIFVGTLAFFFENTEDYEKNKIIEFMGHTLDISRIYEGTPKNRLHRFRTKNYGNLRWKRRYDKKTREKAERWYQCRVVCSNVVDFCNKKADENVILEPNNVYKEIKPFDKAIGYESNIKGQIE
jgi:hypothetical protein